MSSDRQKAVSKEQLLEQFGTMYDKLCAWREAHPEASFDEIASQVTPQRRGLIGEVMVQLVLQHGSGQVAEGIVCEACGGMMVYKEEPERDVEHLEGESHLKHAYYYCAHCKSGIFPPGPAVEVGGAQLDPRDN